MQKDQTEEKIKSFRKLKKDWHYREGIKFTDSTLENAIDMNKYIRELNFAETGAFPDLSGEVLLTIYHLNHYIEFNILENDVQEFSHEIDNEEIDTKNKMSISELRLKLKEIRQEID